MAQAARPLPPEPPAAQRLRVVPPPARRRPSPTVIRRRRIVALLGLVVLIGLPIAVVAIGGGASSDSKRIEALLTTGSVAPATLCDHLSQGMLQAIGGHGACVEASPERGPEGTVTNVRVEGAAATALVTSDRGTERVSLVREDGDWKIDEVR